MKYGNILCLTLMFLYSSKHGFTQVGIGTNTPNSSSVLDISSTTKGLLIPRMTTAQISSISFPATGLLVYQTDGQIGYYFNAGTPALPSWVYLLNSVNSSPWLINNQNIYNSNSGNIGIGTSIPAAKFSVGSNSEFQINNQGNISKINNVPYSFPLSQADAGQFLSNNGSGNLSWTSVESIYSINSTNYQSILVPAHNYVRIQGTITLAAVYNGLSNSNICVTGGTFDGNGTQIINLGSYSVFNGVTFSNIQILGGPNIQFNGCKFTNITSLPIGCTVTGSQILVSTLNNDQVEFVNNSTISSCTIPKMARITNSKITNSIIGNPSTSIQQVSNSKIISSAINNLSGIFSGNICEETSIMVPGPGVSESSVITGNVFTASTTGYFIDINVSTISPYAVNITDNIFKGNTTYPNINHITVHGNYTGTRCIIKVSNNTAIGGTGVFVSSSYTGSADLMVNDNDLRSTGGVGVVNGGFIYVRNNLIH